MDDLVATSPLSSSCCATRYPLLLAHGVGVRDGAKNRIWGRIPQTLSKHGAQIYFGRADAWGTPESNAVQLLERLPAILAESGATKVNIIAHSKGGLDARHLLALFPRDESPIASLTTIGTPHHGSRTIDLLLANVRPVFTPLAFVANSFYGKIGDRNPHFFETCKRLSASHMEEFNATQQDLSPVYSQQFASSLHGCFDSLVSMVTYLLISHVEGPNDGLVTLSSASYDNYRGELATHVGRGVSHTILIDGLKRPFPSKKPPGASRPIQKRFTGDNSGIPLQVDDILDFYVALVADLKDRGY